MALPASAATWRAVRYLVKAAEVVIPAGVAYLADQLQAQETVEPLAWVRVINKYTRATPTGTSEDAAQWKLDLLNLTGGSVDTSWTSGDFAAVATAFDAFETAWKANRMSSHTLVEYRGYPMRFNPSDPGPDADGKGARPFADTGPPVWLASRTSPGTASSNAMPYQVACTITMRTAWPKHWGRIYLPGPNIPLGTGSRWAPAQMQSLANAFFDLQDDLAAAGFLVVIPVGQLTKAPFHALLGVNEVVVDDIPDVVRRRRPKRAAARAVGVE